MKAIYTMLNNKVYRVQQNTAVPTSLTFRAPGVSSTVNVDSFNKAVTDNVFINTLKKPGTKSNGEMYVELVDYLKTKGITEITPIQNFFSVYVDYSMYENGREIDHSAVVKPIEPLDKAVMLGVATNNECVYRRVKTFKPTVEFKIKNSLPHGIMSEPKKNYKLKIHNIAIFEDFSINPEVHKSTYEVPYAIGSSTIQSSLDNMMLVYSTENEGIDIQELDVPFVPRSITLSLELILAGYIVAYNDADIDAILIENLEAKYPDTSDPEVPEGGDNPDYMIPDDDTKPVSDGEYVPNKDGYFDFYERCNETTPHSLLVVEDLIPDGSYDTTAMIRKNMLLKDIPDIEVGEYVIYRESLNSLC